MEVIVDPLLNPHRPLACPPARPILTKENHQTRTVDKVRMVTIIVLQFIVFKKTKAGAAGPFLGENTAPPSEWGSKAKGVGISEPSSRAAGGDGWG